MTRKVRVNWLMLGAASVTLSACGGGGGTTNSGGSLPPPVANAPTPPPPTPTPAPSPLPAPTPSPNNTYSITPAAQQPTRSAEDTSEYRQNYISAEMVNALYALNAGLTGRGTVIGVIDDGARGDIPALAGAISTLSKDFGSITQSGTSRPRDIIGDQFSDHGTAVASIIAGRRDGQGMMGFAPEAQLAILRVTDNNLDTRSESIKHVVAAIEHAAASGIKVSNLSMGMTGGAAIMSHAIQRYRDSGGLLVNSAGNGGAARPTMADAVTAANRDGILFVVALKSALSGTYQLDPSSNHAGAEADRTVTAVGLNATTNELGNASQMLGTSSAAPVVTALAATILSKWPSLTGVEVGHIILNTARDIGEPGTDAVFGRGLVDFAAALSPVKPTLSNGRTSSAIGDAYASVPEGMSGKWLQTAVSSVTSLDAYGRQFDVSLADRVTSYRASPVALHRRLRTPTSLAGVTTPSFGARFGYSSLQRHSPSPLTAQMNSGEIYATVGATRLAAGVNIARPLSQASGVLDSSQDMVLAHAPQIAKTLAASWPLAMDSQLGVEARWGRTNRSSAKSVSIAFKAHPTTLRASFIVEDGSVWGHPQAGALALGDGSKTALFEAARLFALPQGLNVELVGAAGISRVSEHPLSIVTRSSTFLSSAFSVQARRPALGGTLSFGLTQPLLLEAGSVTLDLPKGYDAGTATLSRELRTIDLRGDRRIILAAGYARTLPGSRLHIGVRKDSGRGTQMLVDWRHTLR